jgi:N-acetylglucosamine-6-sulfatase
MRLTSIVVGLVLALMGTLFNLPQRTVEAAPAKPDIVLFYIDDFAPYPVRLWDDPSRTPELARFANKGLDFRNAIASTPICGPARANLLTGKYGHNNGVTQNEMHQYDPRNSIGPKLGNRGYKTAFVGKHINRLKQEYPTRKAMQRLSSGWDRFDVIWENQGRFFDWTQYRKSGTREYRNGSLQHSTYVSAKRAAEIIENSKRSKPLFIVVSLFDGHKPMTPLKRFKGDPACNGIGRWSGPAFNEANVSDKPRHMRATPKLSFGGYPLRKRCEQLLTVDWAVATVRQALKRSGRLSNTLQILTADNGWLMGDHRLEGKTYPYATSVPLYMQWPAVIGNAGRRVKEPVSNVDLGRTFCALAGCAIPKSNGRSLLPLIKGTSDRLERKFLYVEMLHANRHYPGRARARPAWAGVETTLNYSDTLWAFTRYQTGEEELYDLSHDPHRLKNLVGKPAYADVRRELRGFWKQVWDRDGVHWKGKVRVP